MIAGGSAPSTRERNPERSRERILDAALKEFAAHGYAGARVEAIATRAGLNKQLISHHFGGKRGLYESVMQERRLKGGGELQGATAQVPETLAMFFDRARTDPEWVRVLLWEALEEPEPDAHLPALGERRSRYADRVAWIEAEQGAGRLPADLDPTLLLLTLLGAALYPVLLPDVCEVMTGSRPDDEAFAARYREHLARVAGHLADPAAG
ncbi:TetR/AcrR family transcriptional regulator [Aquihabitans sp. McL0605]|uniref:TetR/AcrR family transcriptional regulator n=1 Tax=Aquihabitans sp. McL0605 TaxID=3415671 RepID=UPI003CF308D0